MRKGASMIPILFLVIAGVLFVLAAIPVTIPRVANPGWLGLAFLTLGLLWPLAAKLGGA